MVRAGKTKTKMFCLQNRWPGAQEHQTQGRLTSYSYSESASTAFPQCSDSIDALVRTFDPDENKLQIKEQTLVQEPGPPPKV